MIFQCENFTHKGVLSFSFKCYHWFRYDFYIYFQILLWWCKLHLFCTWVQLILIEIERSTLLIFSRSANKLDALPTYPTDIFNWLTQVQQFNCNFITITFSTKSAYILWELFNCSKQSSLGAIYWWSCEIWLNLQQFISHWSVRYISIPLTRKPIKLRSTSFCTFERLSSTVFDNNIASTKSFDFSSYFIKSPPSTRHSVFVFSKWCIHLIDILSIFASFTKKSMEILSTNISYIQWMHPTLNRGT